MIAAKPALLEPLRHHFRSPVLFGAGYATFIMIACLDCLFTWKILGLGGFEVNPLAAYVIDTWGHWGMVAMKFGLTGFVVGLCELIGRMDLPAARRLLTWAVGLSAVPVIIGFSTLMHVLVS